MKTNCNASFESDYVLIRRVINANCIVLYYIQFIYAKIRYIVTDSISEQITPISAHTDYITSIHIIKLKFFMKIKIRYLLSFIFTVLLASIQIKTSHRFYNLQKRQIKN